MSKVLKRKSRSPAAALDSRTSHTLCRLPPIVLVWAASACLAAGVGARPANASDDNAGGDDDDGWQKVLVEEVKRSLVNVDDFADAQWRRFMRDKGLDSPRYIAAYSAYGNRDTLWVRGRLLANQPYGGPQEDDTWWDNLAATYQRWESDEVPGAAVKLDYGGTELQAVTGPEGYYEAVFELERGQPRSDVVIARYQFDSQVLSNTHRVFLPSPEAEFMIISDMDDTVIHTGITNVLVSAQLTFLHNAKTRKPLPGVGGLYKALVRGTDGQRINPVFYVSNSAWNMWDLLRDFIDLNDLPPGPLLLRDIGPESDTSHHKINSIRRLMQRFATLPAILVGDSGQHDAEIYARIASEFSGRVKAIYVRDVDPEAPSEYDTRVDRIVENSGELGVPFMRVAHSAEIAAHAAAIGLLPASEVDDVKGDVRRDQRRETLAQKADMAETR